jgi:hypothetical protein
VNEKSRPREAASSGLGTKTDVSSIPDGTDESTALSWQVLAKQAVDPRFSWPERVRMKCASIKGLKAEHQAAMANAYARHQAWLGNYTADCEWHSAGWNDPVRACSQHGCPDCFLENLGECAVCAAIARPDYPDPACTWQDDCYVCELCQRCQCHVPYCRECELCSDHVYEEWMTADERREARLDYLLCEHSWWDPIAQVWT